MELPLSKGFVAVLDDDDYDLVSQFRWNAQVHDHTVYAVRGGPRSLSGTYLHSLLTGYQLTDHINGNGLDNHRANLRPSTTALNLANTRKRVGAAPYTSRYKGVSWWRNGDAQRWRAVITIGRKQRHIGLFELETDAARAYDAAAREAFGEFAAVNFALPGEQSAMRGAQDSRHL